MAVVKSKGYGHSLEIAGPIFQEAGADFLGVTLLEEGILLREKGVTLPILVFAPPLPGTAKNFLDYNLTATLPDLPTLNLLNKELANSPQKLEVHVKVDTGMGRIGCLPQELPPLLEAVAQSPSLTLTGIYTHLATAFTKRTRSLVKQIRRFREEVLIPLLKKNWPIGCVHYLNSAGFLRKLKGEPSLNQEWSLWRNLGPGLEEGWGTMVRIGTLLYGQYPFPGEDLLSLESTWTFKARILQVREIPKGWKVGYGSEFQAPRPMRIALLPVGYADGFGVEPVSLLQGWRGLPRWVKGVIGRNPLKVRVRGQWAEVIGRLSAQMCVIDVSHIPAIQPGEEVEIPTRRVLTDSGIPRWVVDRVDNPI